jgi:hypothetical protein
MTKNVLLNKPIDKNGFLYLLYRYIFMKQMEVSMSDENCILGAIGGGTE